MPSTSKTRMDFLVALFVEDIVLDVGRRRYRGTEASEWQSAATAPTRPSAAWERIAHLHTPRAGLNCRLHHATTTDIRGCVESRFTMRAYTVDANPFGGTVNETPNRTPCNRPRAAYIYTLICLACNSDPHCSASVSSSVTAWLPKLRTRSRCSSTAKKSPPRPPSPSFRLHRTNKYGVLLPPLSRMCRRPLTPHKLRSQNGPRQSPPPAVTCS